MSIYQTIRKGMMVVCVTLLLTVLGACQDNGVTNKPLSTATKNPGTTSSQPFRWRPDDRRNQDLVMMTISGGGVKSATFSGEVMFYLEAVGLLPKVNLISSVSGGSFAAARYALSEGSSVGGPLSGRAVRSQRLTCAVPLSVPRPKWVYAETMDVLGQGFGPLVLQAAPSLVVGLVVPGVSPTIGNKQFGDYVNDTYLRPVAGSSESTEYRFCDLNPDRPDIALNATIVSDFRMSAEGHAGKGYLRRRNGDEAYHFAFTDYFFRGLNSDLAEFSVGKAVAASGAFPLLIDYVPLHNFAVCHDSDTTPDPRCGDKRAKLQARVALMDGGANDNLGLTEIYAILGEHLLGQPRSDRSGQRPLGVRPGGPAGNGPDPYRCPFDGVQCMRPGDRALILVVSSAITETTGVRDASDQPPWLLANLSRATAAVDVYSGTASNLRKRLYQQSLEILPYRLPRTWKGLNPVASVEIGLTTLNRYPEGGPIGAAFVDAGLLGSVPPDTPSTGKREELMGEMDENLKDARLARNAQYAAYEALRHKQRRTELALGDMRPQCLFERSKLTDSGLFALMRVADEHRPCLRHAARWAAALRAEELCQRDKPALNDGGAVRCKDRSLEKLDSRWISVFRGYGEVCRFDQSEHDNNLFVADQLRRDTTFRRELEREFESSTAGAAAIATWMKNLESPTDPAALAATLREVCHYPDSKEDRIASASR